MTRHSGVISYVGEKPFKGVTLYSFALESEAKVYYNLGRDKCGVARGLMIEFDFTVNDKGFNIVDGNSVKLTEIAEKPKENKASPAQQQQYNDSPAYLTKDQYWKNKEDRDIEKDVYFVERDYSISYNGAYNSAVEAVSKAYELGLKTSPKTAKGDSAYVAFLGEIDKLAGELFTRYQDVRKNSINYIVTQDDNVVVVTSEKEEEFLSE